jgi:type I restriction enzyme, S subunit
VIHDLTPYPAMKDSGVPWLGPVPEHWTSKKLKFLTKFQNGFPFKPSDWSTSGTPIIRIQNLNGSKKFNFTNRLDLPKAIVIYQGDLLFAWSGNTGTSFGPSIWNEERNGYLNQHIFKLKSHILDNRFLFYALKAVTKEIESQSQGIIGLVHVTKPELGSTVIAIPSSSEQAAIVRFLDHADRRIRRTIAVKQRLIKLLQEQKQVIIHQAVTRGLDPDVKLKPSGVEWLGDVPEGWGVKRLKSIVKDSCAGPYGSSLTKAMYVPNGYKVYGQQQVISADFSSGDYYISPDKYLEMRQYSIAPNDVLITVMGTVGKVSVVPLKFEEGIINPRLVKYRFDSKLVRPEYIKTLLLSPAMQKHLRDVSKGTTMEGLNMEIIGQLALPIPPISVQDEILLTLGAETRNLMIAEEAARREIALLREYRTRLIADVVTGKLDVRGAAALLPELGAEALPDEVEEGVDELDADEAEVEEGVEA